jgi:prolyl-tRNA synthetase
MKLSTLFGRTLRDAPGEAENVAYQLVLRAALARPLAAGSYALLPLGMRVLRRIEAIMHEEMARIGAQEFRTPVVQPSELWEQTGRYAEYGPLMLRLTDRGERSLLVAPTHEEAVAELARREILSHRQMPALVYQIHTKYRDELRARSGMMRMREFTMLDAYSLDADGAGLDHSYDQMADAFERTLERCGVGFVAVDAGAGEMGGGEAREYSVISQAGEDILVICPTGDYAANLEIATSSAKEVERVADAPPIEAVATPSCTTIAEVASFLGVPESQTAKAVFFTTPEHGLLFVVIRGDLEVNETKLRAALGLSDLAPASTEQIVTSGAVPGYASPLDVRGAIVVADRSVVAAGPLVAGANREGYHLRHLLYGRDWVAAQVLDIANVRAGDLCPQCGTPLNLERGIEVGHIFKLGTRYTEALGATYLDTNGASRPIVMGSYGIGLERLMQVIVEQHHDERGMVWPNSVAPFHAQLLRIGKSDAVRVASDTLYNDLVEAGLQVLYDDRDETAGVKFNDADLIGLPFRLVVSERLLAEEAVELKLRTGEAKKIARGEIVSTLREALSLH